jgi:pimeloyl-ACP methyl ester carboxylesterase
MPTTYALIPGAGGSAYYWHRVSPLLTARDASVIAIDLPADDDTADLDTYADTVCEALAGVPGPLIVVGQSMGAFTAPMVAERLDVRLIVLVNPMVPSAGEAPGQWWDATGQDAAMAAHFERIGLGGKKFDPIEDFFDDVPEPVRRDVLSRPEPRQSDTPFAQPWPLAGWPAIPTRVLQGSDDRFFPLDFQRRVVRDRLGLDVDSMPGGHLMALSRPGELAERLEGYRSAAGLLHKTKEQPGA